MTPRSTRDRILDAAETRFADKGFGATALGEIAEEVGIRTPSLYKHFEGKQALYDAVMERLLSPFVATLGELLERPLSPAQSESNLLAIASLYSRTPNLAKLVQHAALAGGEEVDRLMERFFAPIFARATELTTATPYLEGKDVRAALRIVVAFHSLISGYVTLAPLHARLLGEDPLGEESLLGQRDFLRLASRALWRSST
jgi:TetR/AcrR family transcriptional regulator